MDDPFAFPSDDWTTSVNPRHQLIAKTKKKGKSTRADLQSSIPVVEAADVRARFMARGRQLFDTARNAKLSQLEYLGPKAKKAKIEQNDALLAMLVGQTTREDRPKSNSSTKNDENAPPLAQVEQVVAIDTTTSAAVKRAAAPPLPLPNSYSNMLRDSTDLPLVEQSVVDLVVSIPTVTADNTTVLELDESAANATDQCNERNSDNACESEQLML